MNKKFWKNKRVLVTGGNGFIGSHLVGKLVKNGAIVFVLENLKKPKSLKKKKLVYHPVRSLVGDISDEKFIDNIFKKNNFDLCFHLAAQPLVAMGSQSPLSTFRVNIMGTVNILESSRRYRLKGVVLASTTHVYGENKTPFLEEYFPRPSQTYETSKVCADIIAQTYAKHYKLPIAIGRFVNIYGPGDLNERIVPRTIKLILNNQAPEIFNDKVTRDYLYIDDAINGYLILGEKMKELIGKNSNIIYNFGTGKHYTTKELVNIIISLMRSKINPIIKKGVREHEIVGQYVSIKKAKNNLNWSPKYSLEKGLQETISWYEKNIKNLKF